MVVVIFQARTALLAAQGKLFILGPLSIFNSDSIVAVRPDQQAVAGDAMLAQCSAAELTEKIEIQQNNNSERNTVDVRKGR